jgi:hypothetical protein
MHGLLYSLQEITARILARPLTAACLDPSTCQRGVFDVHHPMAAAHFCIRSSSTVPAVNSPRTNWLRRSYIKIFITMACIIMLCRAAAACQGNTIVQQQRSAVFRDTPEQAWYKRVADLHTHSR